MSCSATYNNNLRIPKKVTKNVCKSCGGFIRYGRVRCRNCVSENSDKVLNYTLGQIKELYKDKTNMAVAAKIRGYGKTIYDRSNMPKKCVVCGYNKHYEVCHIKSVKSFSDDTTMREIHNLNNLIALCPNHHWEFDNGIIFIDLLPLSFAVDGLTVDP